MSDTIGARLRQARELRKLTLQQASETTRIRSHYLQALESDDYSAIPSAAQARGFLRLYAEFLALDFGDLSSTIQRPEPAAASEPVPSPEEAKASRPSLWAGLRGRLVRRKDSEAASLPTGLPPQAVEQPDALPASAEVETARRTKAASAEDVKKNAAS